MELTEIQQQILYDLYCLDVTKQSVPWLMEIAHHCDDSDIAGRDRYIPPTKEWYEPYTFETFIKDINPETTFDVHYSIGIQPHEQLTSKFSDLYGRYPKQTNYFCDTNKISIVVDDKKLWLSIHTDLSLISYITSLTPKLFSEKYFNFIKLYIQQCLDYDKSKQIRMDIDFRRFEYNNIQLSFYEDDKFILKRTKSIHEVSFMNLEQMIKQTLGVLSNEYPKVTEILKLTHK